MQIAPNVYLGGWAGLTRAQAMDLPGNPTANIFNWAATLFEFAFESQRNFVNDAGHELRTPITIIQGHLELMGDDPQEREETIALMLMN